MKERQKERHKEELMRLIWESQESHLTWTYKKSSEGTAFHKKCVADYARMMYLTSLL